MLCKLSKQIDAVMNSEQKPSRVFPLALSLVETAQLRNVTEKEDGR